MDFGKTNRGDKKAMLLLQFVCLESSVWNPHHVHEIKALGQVQMRATKILPSLKNKSYEERLKILKLPTFKIPQTER